MISNIDLDLELMTLKELEELRTNIKDILNQKIAQRREKEVLELNDNK